MVFITFASSAIFLGATLGFAALGNWSDAYWAGLVTVLMTRVYLDEKNKT